VTNKNVNCSKYLGVMIDNKLTRRYDIDYVYVNLLKFTSIFCRVRDQVNTNVLRMIYFAFVHPYIALKFMLIHIKHICLN